MSKACPVALQANSNTFSRVVLVDDAASPFRSLEVNKVGYSSPTALIPASAKKKYAKNQASACC